MEEVFLHFRLEPPAGLPSLLRTAQNLLEPFPCRAAPVFTPWFPPAGNRPPLRPARPPPTVTCAGEGVEPEAAPPDPSPRRSWVVAAHGRVPSGGGRSMSPRLQDTLLLHKLHPLQRARWVIRQGNCGPGTDLDQVWRSLCRAIRTAPLPSCTATIRRDQAELWVFCDLQWAELVGRRLKAELQLQGRIRLGVRTMPNVLSM